LDNVFVTFYFIIFLIELDIDGGWF